MPMMICRRDSSWKRASNHGVVDLIHLNELESSMFDTCVLSQRILRNMQPRLLTCLYMSEEHRNIAIWHCHKACNYRNDFGNPRNRRNWLWKQTSLQHFFTNHPICHIFLDWQWIFPYPLAGSSNSYATAHPGYQTAPPKFGPSKYQTKRSGRNTHCQRLFMYHIYIYTYKNA